MTFKGSSKGEDSKPPIRENPLAILRTSYTAIQFTYTHPEWRLLWYQRVASNRQILQCFKISFPSPSIRLEKAKDKCH